MSGVESGALVEYSSNGTDWSTTAPTVSDGSNHTVYVHQIDLAGNISAAHTRLHLRVWLLSRVIAMAASSSEVPATTPCKGTVLSAHTTPCMAVAAMIFSMAAMAITHSTVVAAITPSMVVTALTLSSAVPATTICMAALGNNTVDYSSSSSAISASLLTGTGTHGALSDTYHGIQNLVGSNYDDTLSGDSGDNTLTGGAGKDTIYANQGHDSAYGGDNNDTFYVSSLAANQPTVIDGGARDAGIVQDHFGNVMVLQDLVNGSYNMAPLASVSTNIDTLDIKRWRKYGDYNLRPGCAAYGE